MVRERGLHRDPGIRRRIAWCHVQVEQLRCHGLRTAATLIAGEEPGPAAAVFKLLWSEYHQRATELAVDVLGLDALTPTGSALAELVPHRRPRRAELVRVLDQRLPQRPRRHELRRLLPDPTRHRRGAGARPVEGAPTCARCPAVAVRVQRHLAHFRPRRHLMTAPEHRAEMTNHFAIWDQVTGAVGRPTTA
ncbi:acyl-CoA dehydrogenase family protein [Streptomyces sp. NPDC059909]|uniref:acyl-CoA dehydrogenase family protein n=1 Tax=Streptomyces sp. NPDC059909 TaxID=3346998 RepID=UPI00365F770D